MVVGNIFRNIIISSLLSLGIASGAYYATSQEAYVRPLDYNTRMWCKSYDVVRRGFELRADGKALNLVAEKCTLLPSWFPHASVTITGCYLVPGIADAVIVEFDVPGLEGKRYGPLSKKHLEKLLVEYASTLTCKRNIQAGG